VVQPKCNDDLARAHEQDPQAFAAYCEKEMLAHLALADLELLTSVSACIRFCAPLCAALLGRPADDPAMARLLARLEAAPVHRAGGQQRRTRNLVPPAPAAAR
jgi:LuxR family maltose regulon positive regulatory protein